MPQKSLNEILSKVLEIDPNKITDDMNPETVEAWDSFNGLMLVMELEKNFNVSFTADEITSVKNVGDIKKSLKSHGLKFE